MKAVTNRDFCLSLADALGHKIKPVAIEVTRRALVKNGLLSKSLGRDYIEITNKEAAIVCIAVVLPFSVTLNTDLIKEIAAIPHFIDELAQYIDNSTGLESVTVSAEGASIKAKGERKYFGTEINDSDELTTINIQISKTVFSVACAELQNLKIDSGEMITEEE